ncbi:polymerase [Phyllosticta citriasiana]|uniref:DNA polymerase lambda n=1 Tax=Phyllosticta citriasiana TaxID=595635 RepID=A0ABR1KGX5_9PEZI
MDQRDSLRRKERLFDAIFAMDQDEEDDEIHGGWSASSGRTKPTSNGHLHHSHQSLGHDIESSPLTHPASSLNTTSRQSHTLSTDADRTTTSIGKTSFPKEIPGAGLLQYEDPAASSGRPLASFAKLPQGPGTKKRDAQIRLVREDQRIFKDLVFFFFPNNDAHTARRMRIIKALEYGATWVVECCPYISHVIVDRTFHIDQMKDWLKRQSFPEDFLEGVKVVSESWPSDCITYKSLTDTDLPQYHVLGHDPKPNPTSIPDEPSSLQSSQSLQLKPPKQDVMAREPKTPSQEESCGENMNQAFDVQALLKNADNSEEPISATQDLDTSHNSPGSDDLLDEMIAEAKNTEHLPLDSEDEETSAVPSDAEDTDTEDNPPKKKAKKYSSAGKQNETWQCMKKNDGKGDSNNPNVRTIEILTEMGHYYDRIGDEWRCRGYRRAVSTLKKQDKKIMTKGQAFELPFVGERLATKIEEIVWTNRLRRYDATLVDPMDAAMQTFMQIYGVGLSQASKWVMQGLKTLEDLHKNNVPLTAAQQVGVAHYQDFNTRIPRDEVTRHTAVVTAAIHKIDPDCTVTVGGSYRRGSASCGDIDMLISHPNAPLAHLHAVVLDQLVPQLTQVGYLKVALAAASRSETGSKWHGACALPASMCSSTATATATSATETNGKEGDGPWRRIDVLLVPHTELGAALIYFTGNDIFNRSIRLLASRRKMRLNQRGLYKNVMRGRSREKLTEGELVEGASEKKIFEHLGVPWRRPEHRIC